jgi:hypothetical protein
MQDYVGYNSTSKGFSQLKNDYHGTGTIYPTDGLIVYDLTLESFYHYNALTCFG